MRTTYWLYPEEKEVCSSWHSRSVATLKLESREQPPTRPLPMTSVSLNFRIIISPHLLLPWDWRIPTETTSFHSCSLWIASQIHSAALSQRTQNFNLLPHLCPQQPPCKVYVRLQVWKRGRKSLITYNQASSPVLSSLNHVSTSFYST